jgi:phosphoserine phosphatase
MVERTTVNIDPQLLIERLARAREKVDKAALAFDGDGTLWTGDVGEDWFHAAIEQRRLRDAATAGLLAEGARFGIELEERDPNQLALALFRAYLDGRYPERDCCGMMAWCWAGHTAQELAEHAESVVSARGIEQRLTNELAPILEWARQSAVECVVVSASPLSVVERAAARWGFPGERISAATPAYDGERVITELARPVPYAEAKVSAARALFGGAHWLASFGDNVFDLEMLQAAEVGVAVRPKPRLLARLTGLDVMTLDAPGRGPLADAE